MLKIEISKRAEKFIHTLPPKQKRQIISTVLDLRKNSLPHDPMKLKGHDQFRRADVGESRNAYNVREQNTHFGSEACSIGEGIADSA